MRLDGYPTTLESDKLQLESEEAMTNKNLENVLKLVIEEKSLLHSQIGLTEYIIDLLMLDLDSAIDKIIDAKGPEQLQDCLHIELLPLLHHLNELEYKAKKNSEKEVHTEL